VAEDIVFKDVFLKLAFELGPCETARAVVRRVRIPGSRSPPQPTPGRFYVANDPWKRTSPDPAERAPRRINSAQQAIQWTRGGLDALPARVVEQLRRTGPGGWWTFEYFDDFRTANISDATGLSTEPSVTVAIMF